MPPSAAKETTMHAESLNQREQAFLKRVADFCRKEVDPHCNEWEKTENLPRQVFKRAGELGLLGIIAPKKLGGLGLSFPVYILAIQELAQHFAALALDIAAHNSLCLGH